MIVFLARDFRLQPLGQTGMLCEGSNATRKHEYVQHKARIVVTQFSNTYKQQIGIFFLRRGGIISNTTSA